MGLNAIVAKSSAKLSLPIDEESGDRVARVLAAGSMIRPFATFGHLGDVVDDKLIYDALTTYGSSGGPVLNLHGEVVGIDSAFIAGFVGGNVGISVDKIKPLLKHSR